MPELQRFETRDAAADYVAETIETALRDALDTHDAAALLVSGGSTPGPVFERLSHADLDWASVAVGLVDERWVDETDARSNAMLVKDALLQNNAAYADFTPMHQPEAVFPEEALEAMNAAYRPLMALSPTLLLGMGADGHTASWFPNAKGLAEAMDPNRPAFISAIDATGAPIAGDTPHRATLTAFALDRAKYAILFITGEEKRTVLEERDADLPVHFAERLLGERLCEAWAP